MCVLLGSVCVCVQYHGAQGKDTKRVVSFVGAHMDVVTANPKEFKRPPFELQVEGDMLYGRGVTDCLGTRSMHTMLLRKRERCE